MKIYELKQEVYKLTSTKSTKQLKKSRPDLVDEKDLRLKESWISIYNTLKLIDNFQQEQTEKRICEEYSLSPSSTFKKLLANVEAIGKLFSSIENKIEKLEVRNKK
jgi:hypothetical protein